jgi:hypothetical protein
MSSPANMIFQSGCTSLDFTAIRSPEYWPVEIIVSETETIESLAKADIQIVIDSPQSAENDMKCSSYLS